MRVPSSQNRELPEDRNIRRDDAASHRTGKSALASTPGCWSKTGVLCLEAFRQFRAICVWNFLSGKVLNYGADLFNKNMRLFRFPVSFCVSLVRCVFKGICPFHLSGQIYWLKVVPTTFLPSLPATTESPFHSESGNSCLLPFFSTSPARGPVLLPIFLRTSTRLCWFSLVYICFPFY